MATYHRARPTQTTMHTHEHAHSHTHRQKETGNNGLAKVDWACCRKKSHKIKRGNKKSCCFCRARSRKERAREWEREQRGRAGENWARPKHSWQHLKLVFTLSASRYAAQRRLATLSSCALSLSLFCCCCTGSLAQPSRLERSSTTISSAWEMRTALIGFAPFGLDFGYGSVSRPAGLLISWHFLPLIFPMPLLPLCLIPLPVYRQIPEHLAGTCRPCCMLQLQLQFQMQMLPVVLTNQFGPLS